jgi:pectate lyase
MERIMGRIIIAVFLFSAPFQAGAQLTPAFPGAEGFGAYTPGGRGGKVLIVDTLEDYAPDEAAIPGSLRAAVAHEGPRIVVFRTGGDISLKAALRITEPFITLAGQTAPGGGICLTRYPLVVQTHDAIVRYLRCRPGDTAGTEMDSLSVTGSKNVIIDHCSASWGTDETLSVSGADQDLITVQWCFITESLNESVHHKGAHGYGTLLRTNGRVTFHHNLYAHHRTRCPRPGTYGEGPGLLLDFSNNVIYNWIAPAGYSAADAVRMNYTGNYLKPGPSTTAKDHAFQVGGESTKLYVSGNLLEGKTSDGAWDLIAKYSAVNRAEKPFEAAPVTRDSAEKAFRKVLEKGGAAQPMRDAIDARIVREVRTGGGRIIDSHQDVGGLPEYAPGEAPRDRDNDGMPDVWENQHGLNPKNPGDGQSDSDGDGYTAIEEYINSL